MGTLLQENSHQKRIHISYLLVYSCSFHCPRWGLLGSPDYCKIDLSRMYDLQQAYVAACLVSEILMQVGCGSGGKKKQLIRPWAWIKEGTSYRQSKRSPTIKATKVW